MTKHRSYVFCNFLRELANCNETQQDLGVCQDKIMKKLVKHKLKEISNLKKGIEFNGSTKNFKGIFGEKSKNFF